MEYKVALALSPNRLNGLYGAGRAAEALGMKKDADRYYAIDIEEHGRWDELHRASLAHAKEFVKSATVATAAK